MSRLTRDGTAEPVSRDQILRHARGQGNFHFPCSADHEQDWQPYPVDPYSAICDDHTYIHIYIQRIWLPTPKPHFTRWPSSSWSAEHEKKKKVWQAPLQSTNKVSPFLEIIQPSPFVRYQAQCSVLMKLLLPMEIQVAVCELQATHRPTIIAGLLIQNCVIQVSLLRGL